MNLLHHCLLVTVAVIRLSKNLILIVTIFGFWLFTYLKKVADEQKAENSQTPADDNVQRVENDENDQYPNDPRYQDIPTPDERFIDDSEELFPDAKNPPLKDKNPNTSTPSDRFIDDNERIFGGKSNTTFITSPVRAKTVNL